jgi:hypothetical protein
MMPRALRAKHRVPLDAMALRLRVSVADLRTLEATPLDQWEAVDIRRYVAALGLSLELAAIATDGRREVLS